MKISSVLKIFGVLLMGLYSLGMWSFSGELDQSFGEQGKVITDIFGQTDVLRNVIIDGNGKVVVGGSATKHSLSDHFAILRYDAAGALDNSFGHQGKVITKKIAPNKEVIEGIGAMGIQPDGKIIAAGRGIFHNTVGLVVLRYNHDGSLDTSFGEDGSFFTHDSSTNAYPLDLAIDASNRIIIVAAAWDITGENSAFQVIRLSPDGTLDGNFDDDGKVVTEIAPGGDVPRAVKIDKEGRIVAGGFSGDSKFVVLRYNDDGSLDKAFAEAGIATIHFNEGGVDSLHALAIQDDGKIIVGGDVQVGSFAGLRMVDFGLARLTENGKLDETFNNSGTQITYFVQRAASTLWALSLQADGKIVAVGDASIVNGLGIARYNVDGSLDETFGEAGKLVLTFDRTCHWEAVALQEDGKIVAGGYIFNGKHYDLALARFFP